MFNPVATVDDFPSAFDGKRLEQLSDQDLLGLGNQMLGRLEDHRAKLLAEIYEAGPEWQAALAARQKALLEAGARPRFIPPRKGAKGTEAKRREYISRYDWRLEKITMELERSGYSPKWKALLGT